MSSIFWNKIANTFLISQKSFSKKEKLLYPQLAKSNLKTIQYLDLQNLTIVKKFIIMLPYYPKR